RLFPAGETIFPVFNFYDSVIKQCLDTIKEAFVPPGANQAGEFADEIGRPQVLRALRWLMLYENGGNHFLDHYQGIGQTLARLAITFPARFKFLLLALFATHHSACRCIDTTLRSPPSTSVRT